MSKSTKFNYNTAPQSDSVVIVAAGPSTGRHKNQIIDYIQTYKSIVFAANYNYGEIKSHFTYFTDHRKLNELINTIDASSEVIVREQSYRQNKKLLRRRLKGRMFYRAGLASKEVRSIYRSHRIEIRDDGHLPYTTIGAAGYGCMVLSMLCKPLRMLFVGIDGPKGGLDSTEKEMFDGRVGKADLPSKNIKITRFFVNSLFPSLIDRGIIVETFSGTRLYGLDKKQLGVQIID